MPVFKKYGEEAKSFFKISFLICSTFVKVSQKFPFSILTLCLKKLTSNGHNEDIFAFV